MAQTFVIETEALSKRYGAVTAVDNLTLQVPAGQIFGLLGPNGSGKTTTMGMLLGLVRPTAGRIKLFGEPVEGHPEEALKKIGAIVESPAFYPNLTGRQNLKYFQGISRQGPPEQVDELLTTVGLGPRGGTKYKTYSLGMKQRLGLAYALLGKPDLLFLDEPTNGLDPAGMAEVRDLIRQLGTQGHTILLSSHLLNEVELVCDSVAILVKGKLIAQGNVKELLRRQGAVRIKTTDNPKAIKIVSGLGWITGVKQDGPTIEVGAAPERSWEITAALAKEEVYVSEMAPTQVSLEKYFLDVTGTGAPAKKEEAK